MKSLTFASLHLPLRPGHSVAVSFEIICSCGQAVRGQRSGQAQMVRCSACGAERFVLPFSPLSPVLSATAGPTSPTARGRWRFWLGPLLAAGVALLLAVGGIMLLIRHGTPKRTQQNETSELSAAERLQHHIAVGRAALAEGSFHRASAELAAALDLGDRLPGQGKTAERRQLVQQQREAALLADLLSDSLADIVQHSLGMPEAEWQEEFQRRYAHRAFLLDAVVHRDVSGQYAQNHRHRVGKDEIKIDLKQLKGLELIPFSGPQRLLLGMRLAGVRRDGAAWLIVPEADSGVLITDRAVITALSLPDAAEYEEVLQRQQEWLR